MIGVHNMSLKIPIETSARHILVHEEDFKKDLEMLSQSGYTEDTPGCTLVEPCGSIEIENGSIVAKRRIHMTPLEASRSRYGQ